MPYHQPQLFTSTDGKLSGDIAKRGWNLRQQHALESGRIKRGERLNRSINDSGKEIHLKSWYAWNYRINFGTSEGGKNFTSLPPCTLNFIVAEKVE